MGLFDFLKKKNCDICGEEIGLLGNRKLEDGNMCKNCAALLSPFFSDRRSSTIDQIREQLAYRQANQAKVAAFTVSRSYGDRTKLLIDDNAGVFMVTAAEDLTEANPDVIALSDVISCELDIDESKREIKRKNSEGEEVSYVPPRYDYYFDFNIRLQVQNPYFDDISLRLNDTSVLIEHERMIRRVAGQTSGVESDAAYVRYREMGEELCEALLHPAEPKAEPAVEAEAPRAEVTCPFCGAVTTPDEAGKCEYCGGSVRE